MSSPAHRPLRLVLDTNVVIAGLLWRGLPRRLLESALDDAPIELFSSPVLLQELAQTLAHAKFADRIQAHGSSAAQLVVQYSALVSLLMPAQRAEGGCRRCR